MLLPDLNILIGAHRADSPLHVVCRWIGNTPTVADQSYLQLTDEHFDRAVKGDGEAVRKAVRASATRGHTEHAEPASCHTEGHTATVDTASMPPRRVELLFPA